MPSAGVFERLVLASNNRGKLAEFDALLAPLSITVLPQGRFEIPDAPEPYMTFLENALTKARHAARLTGLAALADDSGLCVDALNGAPGVLSARYAGEPRSDTRNNEALVSALRGQNQRSAHYACVLVLVRHAGDPEPLVAMGRMDGEIIEHPRGTGGFGYDPYFLLPSLGKTVAELDAALKNEISHRALAMQALFEQMRVLPGVAI